MRRFILALTALLVTSSSAPPAAPAAEGEGLCRIYCELWYIGCLATGGRLDKELCHEWYQGCKDGCRAELEPR